MYLKLWSNSHAGQNQTVLNPKRLVDVNTVRVAVVYREYPPKKTVRFREDNDAYLRLRKKKFPRMMDAANAPEPDER
jgi:hypothetical protein